MCITSCNWVKCEANVGLKYVPVWNVAEEYANRCSLTDVSPVCGVEWYGSTEVCR